MKDVGINGYQEASHTLKYVQNAKLLTGIEKEKKMSNLYLKTLKELGAPKSGLLHLDKNDPTAQNYLNLLDLNSDKLIPDTVLEIDKKPVLYIIDNTSLSHPNTSNEQISELRKILSCRGEQAALAIVKPGQLTLYSIDIIHNTDHGKKFLTVDENIIRDLIEGTIEGKLSTYLYGSGKKVFLYNLLFNLLKDVGQTLNNTLLLNGKHEVILSLIGRALFTRFLIDRNILTHDTAPELLHESDPITNCFSSPDRCLAVNKWLDKTFNGDLLPLNTNDYNSWFLNFEEIIFSKLSMILNPSDKNGQLFLPSFVDFSHVPVGLLSEVYESFLHENLDRNVAKKAKKQSVHYTPHPIAGYMFNETLSSVETCEPHLAKVLDPSCGAGVFLITAYRTLVQEHWKATKKRPNTYEIREILYNQITGFDINKEALNLSALGLYLSAIELDAEPLPASKLKFHTNLIGNVLIHSLNKKENESKTPRLGSLGSAIGQEYNGKFDIVIGNPPWTNLDKTLNTELTNVIRSVAKNRSCKLFDISKNHKNPDQVPDLPFVWRSLEWAKDKGNIALALHARFLFKTSPMGIKSREDLFNSINITGILNASALRQTKVWGGHSAQFCLLFAKNEIPNKTDYFYFVSPQQDKHFNQVKKQIKIDYSSAEPIQPSALYKKPYLLKTLSKGTALDVHVIEQIMQTPDTFPLKQYWDKEVGKFKNGRGYTIAKRTIHAKELLNLKAHNLTKHDNSGYIIDTSVLAPFAEEFLEAPRRSSIYQTPLVVINEAIGGKPGTISARISLESEPITYNHSFYGYSSKGFHSPEQLSKYLFILFNSQIFLYFCLMTSSKYGVEREVIQKLDVDTFPFRSFDSLSTEEKSSIDNIFNQFKRKNDITILDQFICKIYNLSKYDFQTIVDTLSISLPTSESKITAEKPVNDDIKNSFCQTLTETLSPYNLTVSLCNIKSNSWNLIAISRDKTQVEIADGLLSNLLDQTNISRIIIHSDKHIFIGILNQYRYWTKSRARLVGMELQNDFSSQLVGLK